MRLLCVSLLLLAVFPGIVIVQAASEMDDARMIERLKEQLKDERRELDSLSEFKKTELEQLNNIEDQLELTSQLVSRLSLKLKRLENRAANLETETSRLDSALVRQRMRLALSLRNFYLKRRRPTRAFLSSSDIVEAGMQTLYAKRSVESLEKLLIKTDSLVAVHEQNLAALENTRQQISKACEEKNLEESLLKSEFKRKDKLMDRVREEEALYREHMQQLTVDIASTDSLFDPESERANGSLFEEQKGRLRFPVRGRIVRNFGMHRDKKTQTDVFSPGIDIKCKSGDEVRAVYDGVVFHRGYLRGYGNVMILDHGDGWYSLYGHLSDYSLELGESVDTGEMIGHVGIDDTDRGAILHFQIRHRKEEYDPVEWLRQ